MRKMIIFLVSLMFSLPSLLLQTPSLQAAAPSPAITITEIHYAPQNKLAFLEFVELYNPTDQSVDLTGWSLANALEYVFPAGTSLAAGSYVVVAANPTNVRTTYGVAALGPYYGKLANDGDHVVLRDRSGDTVDEVDYQMGFPWPIPSKDLDTSIGLINLALDNADPAAWRSGAPTPGAANSQSVSNPPPLIDAVEHTPQAPTSKQTVTIRAHVTDADGISAVRAYFQPVAPGSYIRLTDRAYAQNWTAVTMTAAGNDTYVAEVPAWMRLHRYLIRYRVEAVDAGGRAITVPYADDPQPNFALFVYDGVPTWRAAIQPDVNGQGGVGRVTYDFSQMRDLPVYQLLAQKTDIADSQYIPESTYTMGYIGDDYRWIGTLVVNGVVYDHIHFRARGGIYRYNVGKNNWKFDFNRGHSFQAYDDYGNPYPVKWDKLNFSAVIKHANRYFRGEQGLFETMAYRLFNLFGVPASNTNFLHFRVVDNVDQSPDNQYDGDFWGLYLGIENMDGRFLSQHGLPDGNLYDMKDWTGELDNLGDYGVADKSDLNSFMGAYQQPRDAGWWQQTFDLADYYRFRAVLEAVHHYDVDQGKNYEYYLNPATGKWQVLPWDLDLTWSDLLFGQGSEPFRDRVLAIPTFNLAYQNSMRELRDLLFNQEQIYPMIDEVANIIDTPATGLSMVDADRAMWDFNPILGSRYVVRNRAGQGKYYAYSPTGDFRGMVALMKGYVDQRTSWIDQSILTDRDYPNTPAATYTGPGGYPADHLTIQASAFSDPQGNNTFAALQWRTAELVYAGRPGYDPSQRGRYEIEATWVSPELTTFAPTITVPNGACHPGVTCRVRVRMKDTSGRWSHWSAPVEFVAGAPTRGATQDLRISEIMYKPAASDSLPSADLEFLELENTGNAALDLSNLHFTTGVVYTFPIGTVLPAGGHIVLARQAHYFAARYGFAPFGEYAKELSNKGERLVLADAYGAPVLDVTYADSGDWPKAADGSGYSLVPVSASGDPNSGATWRQSTALGGSPGADDSLPVLVNELAFDASSGAITQIELFNPTDYPADVSNWVLTRANAVLGGNRTSPVAGFALPTGTLVPPRGYWTSVLPSLDPPLRIDAGSAAFTLVAVGRDGVQSGYRHRAVIKAPPDGATIGRLVTSDGVEHFVPQSGSSLGSANLGPQVGPVVISKVVPSSAPGGPAVELLNTGPRAVTLYDPGNLHRNWILAGAVFQIPVGVTLPPSGRLLLSGHSPSELCQSGHAPAGVRVTGPLALPLADQAVDLMLLRPIDWGANGGWAPASTDELDYRNAAPWPTIGADLVLLRTAPQGFGSEPTTWQAGPASAAEDVAPTAYSAVCAFDVFLNTDQQMEIQWAATASATAIGYRLLRSTVDDPAHRELIAPQVSVAQTHDGLPALYKTIDATAAQDQDYLYWLQAIEADQSVVDLAFTAPRSVFHQINAPVVAR